MAERYSAISSMDKYPPSCFCVIEPEPWASAVAGGQITDPGVTARQVDAEVTLQTADRGKVTAEHYSVALVVNLEGPPVRGEYGFVAAITYNVAAVG